MRRKEVEARFRNCDIDALTDRALSLRRALNIRDGRPMPHYRDNIIDAIRELEDQARKMGVSMDRPGTNGFSQADWLKRLGRS